ncbi:MAG TPA: M28 family metallopeptidase [Terriglobales bacterium]|nr:M28 family metallopeptidase [Terriglobales bacterium]
MRRFLSLCLICFSTWAFAQSPNFNGQSWWDYVKVLADDNMQGRETGSPGYDKAAAYVVSQAKADGLQPAGVNGFYQPVKFLSKQIDEAHSSLALVRGGKSEPMVLGDDAIFSTRVDLAPVVDAPLVFVGYGLHVPEMSYDDFAGLDMKGKVAVIIAGSPSSMSAALASHYQSTAERSKAIRDTGALGFISIPNPASMDVPWARIRLARTRPSMELADKSLVDSTGIKLYVLWNPASADKLFAGSGHTFEELAALAKDRKPLPRFALSASVKARTKVNVTEVNSKNIVARLPGSDPKLKTQNVVLSAHLDHLGIGKPINGDRIYNGAMDNGSGSALLLDLAARMAQEKVKLRRSLLFVWVTAEEEGLLGSRYFATQPTVPAKSIVADINTDMFLPIFPMKIVTVYGLDESDLGDDIRQIAAKKDVRVQPDPEPLRNIFIRSDQYSFIREGVPSLAMSVGFEKGSPEEVAAKKWLTERYHAPSDDINQPVDFSAAGKFEDLVYGLALDVCDADQVPHWKPNSFFKRFETAGAAK